MLNQKTKYNCQEDETLPQYTYSVEIIFNSEMRIICNSYQNIFKENAFRMWELF